MNTKTSRTHCLALPLIAMLCALMIACGNQQENGPPDKADGNAATTANTSNTDADSGDADTHTAYETPAGRSPIPQPGEVIIKPLGPNRRSPIPGQGEFIIEPKARPAWSDKDIAHGPKAPDHPIAWTEAPKYVGQKVTVEGKIVDTYKSTSICFLNFRPYDRKNPPEFYLVVFGNNFNAWPQSPEKYFKDKLIRVQGEVTPHQNRHQIKILRPGQIEVIGE